MGGDEGVRIPIVSPLYFGLSSQLAEDGVDIGGSVGFSGGLSSICSPVSVGVLSWTTVGVAGLTMGEISSVRGEGLLVLRWKRGSESPEPKTFVGGGPASSGVLKAFSQDHC